MHRTIVGSSKSGEDGDFRAPADASQAPPRRPIPASRSEDLHESSAPRFRLYPSVGTASDLAQPGGFRRAFVLPQLGDRSDSGGRSERYAYAARPLVDHMHSHGWTPAFVTDVVQALPDGTELLSLIHI